MMQNIEIEFPLELKPENIQTDKNIKNIKENDEKYNLTISVLMDLNDNVSDLLKIQEEFSKDIKTSDLIRKGTYKYPSEKIHFSVIDFPKLSCDAREKDLFSFRKENYSNIEKIKSILQKFDQRKILDRRIDFGYIYTGETKSIAIQAFPSLQLYFFFEEICKELKKYSSLKEIKLKDNNRKRFSVNLLRFFDDPTLNEVKEIRKKVLEINNDSKEKYKNSGKLLFECELKRLSFVISDNWLHNSNPELFYIELK